jgi:hypothetical protein
MMNDEIIVELRAIKLKFAELAGFAVSAKSGLKTSARFFLYVSADLFLYS